MSDELCFLSIEGAAELIASKQISPVELAEAVLARIERLQPRLNAYITVTGEQALAEARTAEGEIAAGKHRGALHGIPIAHKDLFATKGVRTTAGSKILADWVPDHDATVVAKLRDAGTISLGKLGLHEFADGATSLNVHHGDVRNPWDTQRVPGGSSGGSGAAVAAGLAFAATGSDTGGSIRIPAAMCGCVGLMPTYGRASLHGAVPLSWTLDHTGPLTRTVRDAAIVLAAMSGRDPLDPATEDRPVPDWLDGIERGPRGLRVGVPKQYFWDKLEGDVGSLVRKAIADLEGAGASVKEVDFPQAEAYQRACIAVMLVDAAAYHAPNYPSRKDDYSPQVARFLEFGQQVTGIQLSEAMRVLQVARGGEADAVLDGVDVLAVPTSPITAPTIAAAKEHDQSARLGALTSLFDLTGQPAIAVPCGVAGDGLPASISFVGRRWDEASCLRAARAYEMVRGEFPAPPTR